MQLLFFTRLALYLLAFGLPVIHPSIAVPYDRYGWWMCFFLIPGEMLIGYYLSPPRFRPRVWFSAAAGYLLLSILVFPGFSRFSLLYLAAGIAAFLLTALIFKTGTRGHSVAVVEQFALLFLYYKMLSFSRSAESVASESAGITRAILVLIIAGFLLHGIVLYFSAYAKKAFTSLAGKSPSGKVRTRLLKELGLFFVLIIPAVAVIALLMPRDFVSHSIISNILKQEPRPRPFPLEEYGEGIPGGNLRSPDMSDFLDEGWRGMDGRGMPGEGEGEQGDGMLEGVPADQWDQMGQGAGGENRQVTVMIVASSHDPVYAADGYFGQLHPERGLLPLSGQPLNDLVSIRLLEEWEEEDAPPSLKRVPRDIFYLSTIPDRVLAYRPRSIEPTILNRKYHPFDYSYDTVSMVSTSGPRDWTAVRGLTDHEKKSLREYLAVPLSGQVRDSFEVHLTGALEGRTGYYGKVLGIFQSFSRYQYEIGFTDDVSVGRMEEFLVDIRRGDCTEFSNTAAILARMAGVPSRVVTGYLASGTLQGPAHRRGVRMLREVIEPLQDFPLHSLYLVTDAHRHSWVQLYMPGYGWVDFDPTSFAIPPPPGTGLGSMNVVVPLIRIEENVPSFRIPWKQVLRVLLFMGTVLVIGLYLYRYGAQLSLRRRARGQSEASLRALHTHLLMKLSANGYSVKIPAVTALEYARSYPELLRFASLYTVLRYRRIYRQGERIRLWGELRRSYEMLVRRYKKPGLLNALKRFFSLSGLHYVR